MKANQKTCFFTVVTRDLPDPTGEHPGVVDISFHELQCQTLILKVSIGYEENVLQPLQRAQ
jgi:hypothetical protein